MNITIDKAQIADAQEIRLLENKIWGEDVTNKYDIPLLVRFGYTYVAKDGEKVVGAIISYRTNTNEVYVCDLIVDEAYRGQKIALGLYQKLLADVKGMNVITFLEPQRTATMELHKKLGAEVVEEVTDLYGLQDKNDIRLLVRIKN